VCGMRHARYRGLPKTHLEHVYSATALNLIRLDAWWNGHPLDRTRTSHFTHLELAPQPDRINHQGRTGSSLRPVARLARCRLG
jgi:hypothetical protein